MVEDTEDDFEYEPWLPLTQSTSIQFPSSSSSMAHKRKWSLVDPLPTPVIGKENISPFYVATTENPNPSSVFSPDDHRRFRHWSDSGMSNGVEARLLASLAEGRNGGSSLKKVGPDEEEEEKEDEEAVVDDSEEEDGDGFDALIRLCEDRDDGDGDGGGGGGDLVVVECPLCGVDISDLSDELRQVHTNDCLDRSVLQLNGDQSNRDIRSEIPANDAEKLISVPQHVGVSPVLEWLCSLDLARYEAAFVKEEIDWDTLQWLTDEDLVRIGITALGPRKKILHAIGELRRKDDHSSNVEPDDHKTDADGTRKPTLNRLITDFFPGSNSGKKQSCRNSSNQHKMPKDKSDVVRRPLTKKCVSGRRFKEIPPWCCIEGTPFRVDAFQHLRKDCSYWFLTHFHSDHYQGLTKSFCYGKIYCSLITAKLVNLKIGVPWDKIFILPFNEKICIGGVHVTCFDANHCPGAIIILFEPPNGKAILHTGDFRFSEEMKNITALKTCRTHTLILDTTYCDSLYDFPKQEAVIQFVIEAIQAESFNPRTLFLIGCYTIGKERLFLEVARVLRKKVYVSAAKLRVLKCLDLPEDDMQRFTINEAESHIHVVPLWTVASFKRLKQLSHRYADRYSLIISFSPTGWTFGKGKKKSAGRKWQQGTIIRYEVPYSEHSSFSELKEAVKFLSPETIIPSVNNHGKKSSDMMVSLLKSS